MYDKGDEYETERRINILNFTPTLSIFLTD